MNNEDKYMKILRTLDPQMFTIKMCLEETGVNPLIIPRIIRALANIAYGTGHGRVQIFMIDGKITHIKPEESDLINLETITKM